MSDIALRIATERDLTSIHEFLAVHFHNVEPIEAAHRSKSEKVQPNDDSLMSCIKCNTTVVGFSNGRLVGVLIAGTFLPNEHEQILDMSKSTTNGKHADVLKLLAYVEHKADYCNRLNIPEALHIHIVSVHRDYRGRGIANRLFGFCIENGRCLKYQAVTVDCTNNYTARIAVRRDFTLVSSVTYDEYHEAVGERIFEPVEPHMEIKSYALVLDRENSDNSF